MNVTLSEPLEALIERLLASGRYRSKTEVVHAGLRKLAEEETRTSEALEQFPPGSLRRSFTARRNAEELTLLGGSTLALDDE